MAPDNPTPVADVLGASDDQPSVTKVEGFGLKLEIPLPKWAVACLAALIVVGAAVAGIYLSATKLRNTVLIPAAQMEVYEETSFHLTEPNTLKLTREENFDTITITLNYFKSDGCVQIVRWDAANAKGDGLWMFGAHPHSTGHVHTQNVVGSEPVQGGKPPQLRSISYPQEILPDEPILRPVQGRCWDPHPGAFTVMNQPVNQCLVQVWRTFYDGCVHYQFFNPCTGAWDVYPNGAPRVTWTRCLH